MGFEDIHISDIYDISIYDISINVVILIPYAQYIFFR